MRPDRSAFPKSARRRWHGVAVLRWARCRIGFNVYQSQP